VKAHIIPRAFYVLKDEEGKFREGGTVVTLEGENYRETTRRIGVYDETLVTAEGEDRFRDCDNYAAKFFLQDFASKPWIPSPFNPAVRTLTSEHYDSALIQRFCMTVLWRAHATTQPFFANVDLGAKEERLRQLILNDDVGDPTEFSVILYGWSNIPNRSCPVMAPEKVQIGTFDFFQFNTPGVAFGIKVDSRPFPTDQLASVVGGSPELAVLQMPFSPSAAHAELAKQIDKRNEGR